MVSNILIYLMVCSVVSLYYISKFEYTVQQLTGRIYHIFTKGYAIGKRIKIDEFPLKPITGCVLCTTFWSLIISSLWLQFNIMNVFIIIFLTLNSNNILKTWNLITNTIEKIINYLNKKVI